MKKLFKVGFLVVLVVIVTALFFNYKRLNIITGFAAKSLASGVFVANRTQASVESSDNDFSPIDLADNKIDLENQTVTSSVFGLMERKAKFFNGLGAVLLNDNDSRSEIPITPQRKKRTVNLPFPYGVLPQKDTVFNNIDYQALEKAINAAFDFSGVKDKRTRAVLVLYKDQIIGEQYANGFDRDTRLLGWSMTKSITATMYGILEKKGLIRLDSKTGLKEWAQDQRSQITYSDLLHMNSGLEWDEDYYSMSDVTKMLYLSSNMSDIQKEKPLVGEPNKTWNYSSGTTNLLAGELMRQQFKSQQAYLNFWYQEFLDKIGMHSALIEVDQKGYFIGSSYGWATARDWAKFGLFYLHRGYWNGEQIIDSTFVDYITTPTQTSEGRYGGHFWLNKSGYYPDVPKDMFSANGFQGQKVAIIPSKSLVIVRFGLTEDPKFGFNEFLKSIVESIN